MAEGSPFYWSGYSFFGARCAITVLEVAGQTIFFLSGYLDKLDNISLLLFQIIVYEKETKFIYACRLRDCFFCIVQ